MSITGGIKWFQKIPNLSKDGHDLNASSGDASALRAITLDRSVIWRSEGSNDATTETLTGVFDTNLTFNRIFCIGINWKNFDIMYDNSGFVNFTNVISIIDNTPGTGIAETTYNLSTAYYEFDTVTTSQVRIRANTTQTANQEKYLNLFSVTTELGTFQGYPEVRPDMDFEKVRNELLDGRVSIVETVETFKARLNFRSHPSRSPYGADLSLIFSMMRRMEPVCVWFCGGRQEPTYFNVAVPGFRLEDLAQVRITRRPQARYESNLYKGPVEMNIELEESP